LFLQRPLSALIYENRPAIFHQGLSQLVKHTPFRLAERAQSVKASGQVSVLTFDTVKEQSGLVRKFPPPNPIPC